MVASYVAMGVSLGISFFLTPYIVRTLGASAYGFIGLANNFLGYTQLATVALNAMAGRFVSIKYIAGDYKEANKYFSSVFYSNIILALFIAAVMTVVIAFLPNLINIPDSLVNDVKLLFTLLTINAAIGQMASIYGIATFIKNRLDLSSVRGIVGNVINVVTIVTLFGFFAPHVWYMGASGFVGVIYTTITNKQFVKKLTPELKINPRNFDFGKVKELIKSGAWNLISKLGDIMSQELDLLFANLFIGATEMGIFSITKSMPFLVLSICSMMSGVFAPLLTQLYAKKDTDEMLKLFKRAIRISGAICTIPLTFLYIFGDRFYALWVPTQNSAELQTLMVVGTLALPFTLPLEPLWNIFTITNKLKWSSLSYVINCFLVFSTVLICMIFVKSPSARLLVLAGTRALWGTVRGVTYLPLYGSFCLHQKLTYFYPPLFKSILCLLVSCVGAYGIRLFCIPKSWEELIVVGLAVVIICCISSSLILLSNKDRRFLYSKILKHN